MVVDQDSCTNRMGVAMNRLVAICGCLVLCGCGDPSAKAPMLTLEVDRQDGTSGSIGRHRIFSTGVLSESGNSGGGQSSSQRVTVEKITDDGVTLSFEMSTSAGENLEEVIFVRYGQETRLDLPNQSTLVAKLERHQ